MGTTTEVKMWMAGLGDAITASFTNGELTGYDVTGLEFEQRAPEQTGLGVTIDSVNAIRLGMTLESVDALIGSEPSTSSQSEILGTTVAIRMWQDGLDTISVSFTNDVVTGVTWLSIEL